VITVIGLLGTVELVGEGRVEGGLEVAGGEVDEEWHCGGEGGRHRDAHVPGRVNLRHVEGRIQGGQFALVLLFHHELVHVEVQSFPV
jgi:hypothetical protein